MDIAGSVALVTGANRGIGKAYVDALLEAGAAKVYAAARTPQDADDPRVVPLQLDVTDADQVTWAARTASDVQLVISNAGIATGASPLDGVQALRAEMEVNYFGVAAVAEAFAPVLAANGGGALVHMLSALSWATFPTTIGYSASKSAAWALTNGLRQVLPGTQVIGVHVGYVDTDMAAHVDVPKTAPADVARAVLEGIETGADEVLVDEVSRQVRAGLGAVPA